MGLIVLPILRLLRSLSSSSLLLLLLFFLISSISTSAGNLPRNPYSPLDDIRIHKCPCFENGAGGVDVVPHPRTSASSSPKLEKLVLLLGRENAIATAVIIVITLLNVIAYKLRELQEANSVQGSKPALSLASEHSCRKFSLAEMKLATHNFDEALVIGRGGFGKVYKGLINHGASVVAIKRLDSKSKQGASEFWTEIKMLSKLRHSHLVTLFGYCHDFGEMILVYEYVSCGSLRDRLHKIGKSNASSSLSWVQRLKICLGAARALDYLHTSTGVQHRVIHRDVKSSNILLDENWCAKISDFGVSKFGPLNQPWTHVSTDVKGSFGYFDPEYFLTRKLTRKSDVYAFGVVLFEVLFGRPAVDLSLEEEQRGLAGWAQHCIKEGIVERNIDLNLRGQILPNCLTIYVQIAGQCLQNYPRKRPTMSEVVFKLESALALQEIADYSVFEEEIDTAGVYDNHAKEKPSVREEVITAGNGESAELVRGLTRSMSGDARSKRSLLKSARIMPFSRMLRQFFSVKDHVSVHGEAKPSKRNRSNNKRIRNSRHADKDLRPSKDGGVLLEVPNLEVFTLAELKNATRNFRRDTLVGEGGFGRVFKGLVSDKTFALAKKAGIGMAVAIKRLNPESMQGFEEWQSEVNFLGRLSHSNLINLLGYCWEKNELLLVYEYMQKGSLDQHIFKKGKGEPLPWATRLNIMIGAARGLLFLHTLEVQLIFRDFKCSNILLDADFHAKLSDFGMSKIGPVGDNTHVSTRVMGTYGYAAPEYMATGHLTVKVDVYGFGVVLLEILTGQRVLDLSRLAGKHNLVDWVKPFLTKNDQVKKIIDPQIEHDCPPEAAFRTAALVRACLQPNPKVRPSMQEVLEMLEEINFIEMKPKSL